MEAVRLNAGELTVHQIQNRIESIRELFAEEDTPVFIPITLLMYSDVIQALYGYEACGRITQFGTIPFSKVKA